MRSSCMRSLALSLALVLGAAAETAAADAATAPAVATPNPGDPQADLLYVPLAPCRVIDTRLGGGKMAAGETRSFHIAGTSGFDTQGGNSGGCGVPIGASTPLAAAVMINLVAVDVDGKGNLAAWAFGQSQPLASSINYQKLDMNIANGLIVPISGVATSTFDMNVKASFANAHLVADVTGYFTRFPVEQFQGGLKSTVTSTDYTTLTDMSAGACTELTNCAVTATSDGT